MSTGLECEFIEVPGKGHYYVLEDSSAPKDAWNWREYATAYGPFPSTDAAETHLRKYHANPGGSSERGVIDPEKEVYKELLAHAVHPDRFGGRRYLGRF